MFATADKTGVVIGTHHGWTVAISREQAIDYATAYARNPAGAHANSGFFVENGKIILTHGSGKITLSAQEADALAALIGATYLDR